MLWKNPLRCTMSAGGKIEIAARVPADSSEALSLAYTPGVAKPLS